MRNTDQLFESLFKRNFRSVDTKAFLTALTKEYPYFTAAQFYLLKLSEGNSRDFSTHAAKTSLLFNNPFWLNFQLNQNDKSLATAGQSFLEKENVVDYNTPVIEEKEPSPDENELLIDAPNDETQDQIQPSAVVVSSSETTSSIQDITITTENNDTGLEVPAQDLTNDDDKAMENPAGFPSAAASAHIVPSDVDSTVTDERMDMHVQKEEAFVESIENSSVDDNPAQSVEAIEANDSAGVTTLQENNSYDHTNVPTVVTGSPQAPGDDMAQQPGASHEPDATTGYDKNSEPNDSSEPETQPMILKLDFDVKSTTTEDTIAYQPLYTSDYFASLGIKINENGLPVDRLGKQLKSFTDWLKIMKRIHPDHLPQLDEVIDSSIQEIAEKSNKKGEVLTEAMADVLIQQGKTNKAIELYQKLSLLNPSKSAYFAAKIDEIRR